MKQHSVLLIQDGFEEAMKAEACREQLGVKASVGDKKICGED